MVLNLNENVNNNFVGNVVESLIEVLDTALVMLFENFEFRVLLVQFERDNSTDNISEHVLESELITVIIVNRSNGVRVFFLLSLEVGLLSHDTDSLVCSLNSDLLDITIQPEVVLASL